jgi:CHAT domain-containing protein
VTNRLKPLVNAQEEVSNVINIFHGDIFNNEKATESNFKLNSEGYDVLHLAMHTIIDDEDPMYSKMVFSMGNDSTNDGYLNTFEIYNLNLKAQLAVLSACNTGSGKIRNGEGIMSLARGFIYAGVPSIVMTLWEVDDKSGADIMTNFYSYLKDGQAKDKALQNAKLEYLSTASQLRAHPYFWSAYVNVGNSNPLRKSHKYELVIYASILFLAIFAFIFYRRQKKLPK